jgi:hypothetical protein
MRAERLEAELPDHAVRTVAEMGWSGTKNGELPQRAAAQFDCFLTVDRNLQFQQNIESLPLSVLVIRARDNRLVSLRPLMTAIREGLASIAAHELKIVGN